MVHRVFYWMAGIETFKKPKNKGLNHGAYDSCKNGAVTNLVTQEEEFIHYSSIFRPQRFVDLSEHVIRAMP